MSQRFLEQLSSDRRASPARRSRLALRPAAGLPGCRPWAGPSGPVAMPSGRAGLPRQAIVSEGQEAGRAGCLKMLLFGNRDFGPTAGPQPVRRRASPARPALSARFRPAAGLPGRRPWTEPSMPAAMPSGRGGLPGRRSFLRGGRSGGPDA